MSGQQPSSHSESAPPEPIGEPDPDRPHSYDAGSPFAFSDAQPIGETDRIAREKSVYEAAPHGADLNRGHAVGGSDGSTEGQ